MKREINEIYFLRGIACLSVVFLHSVSSLFRVADFQGTELWSFLRSFQLLLLFCTPTFVLISEFLISHSYQNKLPAKFYTKRVQGILLPYIFIGFCYTAFQEWNNHAYTGFSNFLVQACKTVFLGSYYGYFVLIIFQFYIIHPFFQKYIYRRFSIKSVLLASFLISFLYQVSFAAFNFPFESLYFRLLFPGWLIYFSVGFYAGKHYHWIKQNINRYIKYLLPLVGLCSLFLLFNYHIVGFTPIHSKRPDLIIYTLAVAAILFYTATRIRKMPSIFIVISSYSYGIYLLHPFFLRTIERFVNHDLHVGGIALLYIILSFVATVFGCIGVIYVVNLNRYGQYLVGRINIGPKKKEKEVVVFEEGAIDSNSVFHRITKLVHA